MEERIMTPPSQPKETEPEAPSGSPMTDSLPGDTASAIPATSTQAPQTLKEALDNIRELYEQEQAAKWGQGEQVNFIEDAHLALREGYKKAKECFKRELPDIPPSSLYRQAYLAKYYRHTDRERWGIAKLQVLAAIQKQAHGKPLPGDPAEQEVQVPRADGFVATKKFRDCTLRELQSAAKRGKQARKNADRGAGAGAKEAALSAKPSWPVRALAMLGIGLLGGFVGNLLLPSEWGLYVVLPSGLLVLAGTSLLVRYLVSVRERVFAAFKAGYGKLKTIKEDGIDLLRSVRHLVAVLKSVQSRPKTTANEETSPPSQKKAA